MRGEFKGIKIVMERKGLFTSEKEFEIELGEVIEENLLEAGTSLD